MEINHQATAEDSNVSHRQALFDFELEDAFNAEQLGSIGKTLEELSRRSENLDDAIRDGAHAGADGDAGAGARAVVDVDVDVDANANANADDAGVVADADADADADVANDPETGETADVDNAAEDTAQPAELGVKKTVTKKAQLEHLKKRKDELVDAASQIYMFGRRCREEIDQQAFNAAIPGLAMILGTYRNYFDDADDDERKEFTKILILRCRVDLGKNALSKTDKRTTPFHLLSRLFRSSERRQASSDTKILRLAHKEMATQESFESWVKGHGSLAAILRKIRDEDGGQAETQPEKKRHQKPFSVWVKAAEVTEDDAAGALEALKKLADGKRYTTTISYHAGRFDVMRLIEKPSAEATETKTEEREANENA